MVFFFSFSFNFLCRRDRSRTCLVCCHFSFDVASFHEMPSVSFHPNLETLKLLLSQSSCSQFFFNWGRLFAFMASSTCRSLQIRCQGKGDRIISKFFFNLISLHAFLLDGPFHFFFVIVVDVFFFIFWLYFILFLEIKYSVAMMHPCKMELLLL